MSAPKDATCRWCSKPAAGVEPRTHRRACAQCLEDLKTFDRCKHCRGTGVEWGVGSFDGIGVDCGWCENGLVEP